ncbi:hypothetical protein N7510_000197 [Penicillium lagena]|uniref:uncharacterized protein n=1 Tax=Penicillium lagena TaxID=94218 RepID=UPI00253FB7DC|nr:uncharacterized protein N7510_000197 [Penicillium lagena]KAJ5623888.1 hypothetical protein N7510_000197 [Penicillium lagena]
MRSIRLLSLVALPAVCGNPSTQSPAGCIRRTHIIRPSTPSDSCHHAPVGIRLILGPVHFGSCPVLYSVPV